MSRRSDIAGRVFSRLSAAGLAEASTLQRKNTVAEIPVTVVLRRSVERVGTDGQIYLQTEITGQVSELGTVDRGDRFTVDGERWIVDAPSKRSNYTVTATVIPDRP